MSGKLFAVALHAVKVPHGCTVKPTADGVVFGALLPRVDVSTFLKAAWCCSASVEEAEARWLAFLRESLPARDGWAYHKVSVEELPDLGEMIDRHDRGEPLAPEAPSVGTEPPDDAPVM